MVLAAAAEAASSPDRGAQGRPGSGIGAAGIWTGYRRAADRHDEALTPDGTLRPAWRRLSAALSALDASDLARVGAEAAELLEDAGRASRLDAGWVLDPLPMVLIAQEWEPVDRGLRQRAELLDHALRDLYGPRHLVRSGLLPPEVLYGHDGFLRQVDPAPVPDRGQLLVLAADLTRGPDGSWLVQSQRAAPSGAGDVLQHRSVLSRALPAAYRAVGVQRLSAFYHALRATLYDVAPAGAEVPRVVVLTPGPFSAAAAEHAFLAARLGYPLVQGSDLTYRDGRLWLRSLGRPEPVDVVLRQVDPAWCDALDLRADSVLGVPGLLEAVRLGSVSVVNPLGSGIVESPALLPFLPGICRAVLGEELQLPSLPTWWCGDPAARGHVRSRLDRLVVRPVNRAAGEPVRGWELTAAARDDLWRAVEADPCRWVAQERVEPSSVPTVTSAGLEPRPMVLRTFTVGTDRGFLTMPGGLPRLASSADGPVGPLRDAAVKDVWVLTDQPAEVVASVEPWLGAGPAVPPVTVAASMPRRAAEDLFWLGRYAERAEGAVRLLRTAADRWRDHRGGDPALAETIRTLLVAVTRVTDTGPGFVGDGAAVRIAAPSDELVRLLTEQTQAGTVAHSVRQLALLSTAVRDQLSVDTDLVLGGLDRQLADLGEQPGGGSGAAAALDRVLEGLLAFAGIAAESMIRDPGWRLMDVGRRVERAMQVVRLLRWTLDRRHAGAAEGLVIESVLAVAESIITYRRRYRAQAGVQTVLDLLLADRDNPRSVAYQLDRVREDLAALKGVALPLPSNAGTEADLLLAELTDGLRLIDTGRAATVSSGRRPVLVRSLDDQLRLLGALADAVDAEYFERIAPQRVLTVAGIQRPGSRP